MACNSHDDADAGAYVTLRHLSVNQSILGWA